MIPVESPILIPIVDTTPPNPPQGYTLVYIKSDNQLYVKLSDGTEKRIS